MTGESSTGKECKDISCESVSITRNGRYGVAEDEAGSVSSLELFPNPATSNVNINFKVEAAGQVNIAVADIQGRVLAVVQDAYMTAGYHNVTWNVAVNPGLYIVTIKTSAGTEQKQLLIQQQ